MKYLIDKTTNEVRGRYQPPLDFSISGKYIIDISNDLAVEIPTNLVTDLINSKIASYLSNHPSLPYYFNDELIVVPNIDPLYSVGYLVGPSKRTAILPGGHVSTNIITFINPVSDIFLHYYGFVIHSHPGPITTTPEPNRLLYNYDSILSNFIEFDPSWLTVEIIDTLDTMVYMTPTPDMEVNFIPMFPPFNFRLKFTNVDTKIIYLSDWMLMFG